MQAARKHFLKDIISPHGPQLLPKHLYRVFFISLLVWSLVNQRVRASLSASVTVVSSEPKGQGEPSSFSHLGYTMDITVISSVDDNITSN